MLRADFVANNIVAPIYTKALQKIEKAILHEAGRGFINCHFSDVSLNEAHLKSIAGILEGYGYVVNIIPGAATYTLDISWKDAFVGEGKSDE